MLHFHRELGGQCGSLGGTLFCGPLRLDASAHLAVLGVALFGCMENFSALLSPWPVGRATEA